MPDTPKDLFILDSDVTYLNCANMSPMLKSVKQAGLEALETRARPWRIATEDWFLNAEKLRSLAARLFQTNTDNIALIPSASYGLATAAKNLKPKPGTEILILEQQFPSNYYVWENMARQQNLMVMTVQKSQSRSLTESILQNIGKNTSIIAIPNCHWIDGAWIDLEQIAKAAKAVDAYLVLDLSQSLGVLPAEIDRIQPDFAVSVGYKWLLGPYSLSYLYASKKWQESGEPLEYSWITRKGSDEFSNITSYESSYREGARKFDMGKVSQFNLLPMAIAALEQILDWGVANIQTAVKKLTDRINDHKNEIGIPGSKLVSVGHISSIPLENLNVRSLKNALERDKVVISFRGTSIRVSPHLYNDDADIDKLLECLKQ